MSDAFEKEQHYETDRKWEPKKEEDGKNLEFVKGTFFGILLSAVCVMAVYLISHGTVGLKIGKDSAEKAGAEVLTSSATINKLEEIEDRISSSFLYEVDGEKLSNYLFKGMTIGLEDPYANYYTAEEIKTVTEMTQGEYYGIGVTLLRDPENGTFRIAGVYEGSPAWEAGMQTDDQIIKVNGETVEGLDLSTVVAKVKQSKEKVVITVLRDEEEEEFTLELTSVAIPTVTWEMLEDGIGYLKIAEFDSITVEQFEDAAEQLKEQGMEKLIIDVRDNPGGTLSAVCEIMDNLLPEGLIVYTEDKNGYREEYRSDEEQIFSGPMAVLVNGNSASASEIFAGTVQDYGLGPIIGTATYGKGVVQRTYLLSDGSALKLTAEKYYTAKGQDIDGNGITPDYIVEQTENSAQELTEPEQDLQLQRAINYFMEENR